MTQDEELIALAVQADLCDEYGTVNYEYGYLTEIIAYGKLVAAKEREACALLAQKTVCDTHTPTGVKIYGTAAAKAIRARGEA